MDTERFQATMLPIRDKLFRTARRMLEDEADAEDAVQEIFLKFWMNKDQWAHYDSIEAVAMTAVKNYCIDTIRKRQRTEAIDDRLFKEAGPDEWKQIENRSNEALIHQLVETLPTLQKSILRMKDIEGYELDEIAQILGSTNESVRVNLSRARKKIRTEFIRITKNEQIIE